MKIIKWSSRNKVQTIRAAVANREAFQVVLTGRVAVQAHEALGSGAVTGGELVALGVLALAAVTAYAISQRYEVKLVRKRDGTVVLHYSPKRGRSSGTSMLAGTLKKIGLG